MLPLSVGIAAMLRVMLTDWMASRKRRFLLRKLRHHRACRQRRAEKAALAAVANERIASLNRGWAASRQSFLSDLRPGL